jgi:hypothetical protein
MTLPLTSLIVLLATVASAQPSAPEQPSAPPLPSSSDACASAEAEYTRAFDALVQGANEQALTALEHVLAVCPTHPYASEFARLARARLAPGARLAEAATLGPEKRTGFDRGSLVVWQTVHGAAQGALLCGIADCGNRAYLGATLLGAAAGAGSSWLLTEGRGVTSGEAAAINTATIWGVWYGLATSQVFDLSGPEVPGTFMASMAVFTGAGVGLALLAHPTAGQVSMANSGGLWAGVVTGLFIATADSGDTKTFFIIETVATGVGLTSLALLSQSFPVSRGRVLLIDSGGILGGLLGAATVAVLGGQGDPVLIGAGLGALAGLGTTLWLTDRFDRISSEDPQVMLAPTVLGRGGAGLALGGRF